MKLRVCFFVTFLYGSNVFAQNTDWVCGKLNPVVKTNVIKVSSQTIKFEKQTNIQALNSIADDNQIVACINIQENDNFVEISRVGDVHMNAMFALSFLSKQFEYSPGLMLNPSDLDSNLFKKNMNSRIFAVMLHEF